MPDVKVTPEAKVIPDVKVTLPSVANDQMLLPNGAVDEPSVTSSISETGMASVQTGPGETQTVEPTLEQSTNSTAVATTLPTALPPERPKTPHVVHFRRKIHTIIVDTRAPNAATRAPTYTNGQSYGQQFGPNGVYYNHTSGNNTNNNANNNTWSNTRPVATTGSVMVRRNKPRVNATSGTPRTQ
jgi:hypothetical protein